MAKWQGANPMVKTNQGFSLVELMVVVVIMMVLMAMALPSAMHTLGSYRLSGAARGLAGQLSLARLRAAANFTQSELVLDIPAECYEIATCTTKNSATGGCTTWTWEGGIQYLPGTVTYGFGSISTGAGGQSGGAPSQTTAIVFNSRGVAINSSYQPTSTDAIYLTNSSGLYYAVTVNAGGKPTIWVYTGGAWKEI